MSMHYKKYHVLLGIHVLYMALLHIAIIFPENEKRVYCVRVPIHMCIIIRCIHGVDNHSSVIVLNFATATCIVKATINPSTSM